MIWTSTVWDMTHINMSCKQRRQTVELLLSYTCMPQFLCQFRRKDTIPRSRQRFPSGRRSCENVYAYRPHNTIVLEYVFCEIITYDGHVRD